MTLVFWNTLKSCVKLRREILRTLNPCPVPMNQISGGACEFVERGTQHKKLLLCYRCGSKFTVQVRSWKYLVRD
jgi:hypothetical protein